MPAIQASPGEERLVNPDHALKDRAQSFTFENFRQLMTQLPPAAASVGRRMRVEQERVSV